ncbi:MAG: radical SAM protein [Promethearchaeota archaeon]
MTNKKKPFLIRKEYFGGLLFNRIEDKIEKILEPWEFELLAYNNVESAKNQDYINRVEKFIKDCEEKGVISNGKLNAKIIDNIKIKKGVLSAPMKIFLHITNKCNLKCSHCMFRNENSNNEPLQDKELTEKEIIERILDPAEDLGIPQLRITGGEPTLRTDIFNLINYAKEKKNMTIWLNTNGSFEESIRTQLAKSRVDGIIISLDGNRKINDQRRGQGTYKKIVDTLRFFQEYNHQNKNKIQIRINTTISKENVRLTEYLINLSRKYETEINFMPLRPMVYSFKIVDNMLTTKEFMEFSKKVNNLKKKFIEKTSKIFNRNCDLFGSYENCSHLPPPFDNSSCNAATSGLGIAANGDGLVCGFLSGIDDFKGPNVRDNSLFEIWHSEPFNKFRNTVKKSCENCRYYRKECLGVCNVMSYIETKEFGLKDRYCFAHLI